MMNFSISYIQDEDGIFTAIVQEIPGCIVSGNTPEEAYQNAIEAIEDCLEAKEALTLKQPRISFASINTYSTKKTLAYA